MTRLTIGRDRRDSRVRVMASETPRMAVWDRLESALLQPESIAQLFRRLGHVFFARLALRLISLMTNTAVRRRLFLLLVFPRHRYKCRFEGSRVTTDDLEMGLVREMHCELTDEISSRSRGIGHVSQTRKQESHCIARGHCNVAIGADSRSGPFAREELLPVAIQTRSVLWKLGDVREGGVAFSNFLPVGCRKLVAPGARQLLFCDVSGVGKLAVVYGRLFRRPRCRTTA